MRSILLPSVCLLLSACGCSYDGSTTTATTPVARFDVKSDSEAFGKAPDRGEARIVYVYTDGTTGRPFARRSVVKGQRLGFQRDGEQIVSVIGQTVEPVKLTPETAYLLWEVTTEHQRGWHMDLASFSGSDRDSHRHHHGYIASGSRDRSRDHRAEVAASRVRSNSSDRGSRYGDSRDNDSGSRQRTRD